MELPKITLDDMFTIQGERDAKETIVALPLSEIDDFPNHPYKVKDDEKMQEMSESIKQYGVTQPVIVRKKDNGRYEMISGHRRKRASILAGKENINAIVKNLTDEEAVILMVDSNESQRDEILPSEKAFAYKMKNEALKRQAGRKGNDEINGRPVVTDLKTADILGKDNEESGRQVLRYIRLTELIPEILDMVDEKKIAFRPAVEISYLSEENQYVLLDVMQFSDITPSLAQAIHMKKLEQENKLDTEKIEDLMSQEKPNQVEKLKFNAERFESEFPKNIRTNQEKEDFLFMCVQEHNQRERAKKRAMER
ncbi:MAG: ParB/RepB/Spo0J family partition protein [Clostridia bacterium]|nr:ParB/RepB/Spo0J family partition protein [Clostridia bacterium]